MRLSERDAYIKAMIAKSPTYDESGDMERIVGEEYDKHSQPLPEGKVWRWGGFLAMFRAGAEWAAEGKQAEINALKQQRDSKQAAFEASADSFARVLDALKTASPASIVHHLNGEGACLQMINDMRYQADALKQQNAALLAAQQWRDIESAPKDGTRILVYAADTHEIFSVSWMTAQEDGSQEWIAFRFDQIGAVAIHNATLWQPMPWPELARGDL